MNEIDLYVSLIDEKEANKILSFFNQSVKTGSLEFKKTKIKTIFRGKLPTKKKNSFGQNPFWVILQSHQIERYKNYEEKDFFIELNSKRDDIPYYVKLANLIIKFPDKIDEYLKLITDNINLGKYPFDFGIEFNDESEIMDYFNNTSYISNNKLLLELIDKYYDRAVKSGFILPIKKSEIEIIKKYSLKELYTRINKESDKSITNIKYEYINSHIEMEEELFKAFCVDIIIGLVRIFYEHENDYGDKDYIIESLKSELTIMQENEKNLIKNIVTMKKNIIRKWI
ncbi:hypothetical protein [uncultured Clostridium sp.]|uniref:hypothetical protein n=1 Tax=uncultured Clostridium sp. TaxID=59620 RepID=UPI00280BFE7A|nr:hypothetical protein [uncultured Clostridium sp.]